MDTFQQTPVDDGLPTVQEESETTDKDDAKNGSFQFPFFDNGELLDLSASKFYTHEKNFLSPLEAPRSHMPKASSTGTSFPNDFVDFAMELSPIVKNRGSDTSQEGIEIAPSNSDYPATGREVDCKGAMTTESLTSAVSKAHPVSAPTRPIAESLSHTSEPSNTSDFDDLRSARKQVGESSNNFIDKIRNAAHKRKVAVTRSRDSLVAKEEEQLRSIAESKARSQSLLGRINILRENDDENIRPNNAVQSEELLKNPFMNRNRKNTDGGFSGVGVPKVKKRPTTTPFSPLLGSRRKEKMIIKALQKPKTSKATEAVRTAQPRKSSNRSREQGYSISSHHAWKSLRVRSPNLASESIKGSELTVRTAAPSALPFTARPLPTSSREGYAGQVGVPKVPKREVTVPLSPCLGPKRPSNTERGNSKHSGRVLNPIRVREAATEASSREKAEPSKFTSPYRKSSSASTAESSELLGLTLLDISPEKNSGHERLTELQNLTPRNDAIKPFEPKSTCRAHKRAEYDVIRDDNLQRRLLAEQQRRQEQIKRIHQELAEMSKGLT